MRTKRHFGLLAKQVVEVMHPAVYLNNKSIILVVLKRNRVWGVSKEIDLNI